jgi:hypothetical protein
MERVNASALRRRAPWHGRGRCGPYVSVEPFAPKRCSSRVPTATPAVSISIERALTLRDLRQGCPFRQRVSPRIASKQSPS